MKLKGKVAMITGGGRGLGRAAAVELAKAGASVVVISRTTEELRGTAKAVKDFGGSAVSFRTDVSRPKAAERAVRRAVSHFGRIDILMNNAAIVSPVGLLHEVDEKSWDLAVATNLRAAYLFSHAVVPYMMKQGGGKIINVTSGLGEIVMPPFGVYSITKAGLIHLTKIMAEELKDFNIQVNGLDPGVMDTRMQEEIRDLGPAALGKEIYSHFVAMHEKGYLSPPEKASCLAVFLSSEDSDSITGQNGTEDFYRVLGYSG